MGSQTQQRTQVMRTNRALARGLFGPALAASLILLVGCGGSSPGSSSAPPVESDFTVTVNPMSLTAAPGTSTSAQVSLQALGTFSGQVTVSISGLPSGVSTSPASPFTLNPAGQALTFNVSSAVAVGSSTVSLQATSGNLSHSTSLTLQVEQLTGILISLNLVSPIYITAGTSYTTNVGTGLTTSGPANYQLQLSISGVPSEATATFANNPIPAATSTLLTITVASGAALSLNNNVIVTATRTLDGAQATASFILNVVAAPGNLPNNRTTFVRTDDTSFSAVYDPAHHLVFASLPDLNRVDVISPATSQIVKSIPVAAPQFVDITLDHSRVIVGTITDLLCFIDTSALQVNTCTTLPKTASVNGFITPSDPLAVSTGDVLINGGSAGVLDWNPATNGLTEHQDPADLGGQWIWTCSQDGTKVLISNYSVPGKLILYDSASGSFVGKVQFNTTPFELAANPNGTQFAVGVGVVTNPNGTALQFQTTGRGLPGDIVDGIFVLNANLGIVATLPISGTLYGIQYSLDGKSIYAVAQPGGAGSVPIIYTVNASTFQVVTTAPTYASSIAYFRSSGQQFKVELPLAIEDTGIIIGAADHGIVLDDSTYNQSFSSSISYPSFTIIVDPAEGPLNASTPVLIKTDVYPSPPDIWFGEQLGTNLSLAGTRQAQATAPPSSTSGPVDVKVIQPTGVVSYIPQGFTYGELAQPSATLVAAPAGGVTADLFGYGFSVDAASPNLQVMIGNQAATLTSQTLFPTESIYPFPLQHLKVTVPSGSAAIEDIKITSSSGVATIPSGFQYANSVTDYSDPAQFEAVLYDRQRQQLYLTTQGQVEVFSLASNSFRTPIVPPTLNGQLQLMGMAMTPDSSNLLVANYADQSLAIINPDNPSSAHAVAVGLKPFTIAATSTNQAFIATVGTQLVDLDLSSLQVTALTLPSGSLPSGDLNYISASSDGSKVFLAGYGGSAAVWNAQTDTWQTGLTVFANGAASAGDGNFFAAKVQWPMVFDPNAAWVGLGLAPDYLPLPDNVTAGIQLHQTGSLLYLPYQKGTYAQNGVDVYDVRHGDLRERILLNENLANRVNGLPVLTMALDETGERIFLITDTGLTISTVPTFIGNFP